MNNKIKCPECGHENQKNTNQCSQCDEEIRNYTYFKNNYTDFYKLFNTNNIEILKKIPLTDTAYDSIINNIIEIGQKNLQAIPENPNTQHLIKISKPYARVQYDNTKRKLDLLSYYSFNHIYLNRNTPHQMIPGAIIHELSHHLLNEIIKQSLMHLLNQEINLYIESFAWYLTLQNDYTKIANEFISHRVQEHFIPEHFTGYTSLKELLENNTLEKDKIERSLNLGLTLSEDIIFILEKYTTPTIKVNPEASQYHNLEYNIQKLDEQKKLDAIYTIILGTFEFITTHKRDMQIILSDINENYIQYNV
ncbi:MAG: hypothetical protein BZ138_05690 [Methanosphaera sp. rholeuAM270]|nr:MAG: hypothetical protein BZ138_05690 [Methanosphaera sp. rholeuAM270]